MQKDKISPHTGTIDNLWLHILQDFPINTVMYIWYVLL